MFACAGFAGAAGVLKAAGVLLAGGPITLPVGLGTPALPPARKAFGSWMQVYRVTERRDMKELECDKCGAWSPTAQAQQSTPQQTQHVFSAA